MPRPLLTPADAITADAMARHLTALMDALAVSRLHKIGDDGHLLCAIEYAATELEDLAARIEAARERDDDERGLRYLQAADAAEWQRVLTLAWLADEPRPVVSLAEHRARVVADAGVRRAAE